MKVLVACEFSGIVRNAFLARGHDAWSCDLLPSESPLYSDRHIIGDVRPLLRLNWDLLIAHPPCRYLANSGRHWEKTDFSRYQKRLDALDFAEELWNAPIPQICLENPRSALASRIGPCTMTFHPWMFGDPYSKLTCLWLKNLNPPRQTCFQRPSIFLNRDSSGRDNTSATRHRAHERSRFFPRVAEAMALRWG